MPLATEFVEAKGAVYGRKPPKPTSAWLLTRFIGERSTDSKVKVIDMGANQEYEFRGGEADQWPKEARRVGNTRLKDSSWEGWWRLYLVRRRKYHSKPDGKWKDPLGESVEQRDDGYYVHTPGGRVLGPFEHPAHAGMEDMFWINGADAGDEDELFAEGEPGVGEKPADGSLARKLAKQMLGNKASLALPFRQLWRHKYIKKNYDASQAWKLFYWEATHAGAGGKGFNPATRKAAAKLMVGAFGRWAKAGMKAKVKRSDGVVEKPVGEISRAEFVKWFVSSAPGISEGVLGAEFVTEARPDAPPAKKDKRAPHEGLRFARAHEQGVTFETGRAVTFRFMHSNEKAPKSGGRFQQDIEPAGYYMIAVDQQGIDTWKRAEKDFDHGLATFKNPLVLDWGMSYDKSSWKYALWLKYGKKRRALTRAILRDGYDGIVTVRGMRSTSEIVALKGKPKMVESLGDLFVDEQDDDDKPPKKKAPPKKKPPEGKKPPSKKKAPPPPPEDDEEEMTDLEREEEKAEKLGYELKDVQAYYDMQISGGLDQGAALVKTKKKFKLRRIKVSPIGKVMAPQVPNPEKLRKKEQAKAPPPPPEEEPAGGGGGGGEAPMAGGGFPEGPRGPQGPQGPPSPGGE